MKTEILYRPSYSLAVVELAPSESIQVEAAAMVSMSQGISLETSLGGGLLSALKRSILGGESFFMNEYRAPAGGGKIMLAPALPGDIVARELQNGHPARAIRVIPGLLEWHSGGHQVGRRQDFFRQRGLVYAQMLWHGRTAAVQLWRDP